MKNCVAYAFSPRKKGEVTGKKIQKVAAALFWPYREEKFPFFPERGGETKSTIGPLKKRNKRWHFGAKGEVQHWKERADGI